VAGGALSSRRVEEAGLKNPEEVMEILKAFDLTGTLRGAAELVGCDHKTVAHWVRARDEGGGGLPVAVWPRPRVDAFAAKIEEWVERSRGKVRADVCHQRLVAMGYVGSERTTSGRGVRGRSHSVDKGLSAPARCSRKSARAITALLQVFRDWKRGLPTG
jgi:hypothetical protein